MKKGNRKTDMKKKRTVEVCAKDYLFSTHISRLIIKIGVDYYITLFKLLTCLNLDIFFSSIFCV